MSAAGSNLPGLHLVPGHMHNSIVLWIERGFPHPARMGSFLRAVLCNDLMGAFAYADQKNRFAMSAWATFLYNFAPGGSYGSPEKVRQWHEQGGLYGAEGLIKLVPCSECAGSVRMVAVHYQLAQRRGQK